MNAAKWLMACSLAGGLWGQSGTVRFVGAPAHGTGAGPGQAVRGGIGGHRPVRVVGGWGWGGWGWWNPEPVRIVVQPEPQKEKEAPPYVTNKEYVPDRLAPRLTEVAAAPAMRIQPEWRNCSLELVSGERFESAQCAEVDDTVLVKARSGRRYRFSRDLVDEVK